MPDSYLLLHPLCLQSYLYWLSDAQIASAKPFEGWVDCFHDVHGKAFWSISDAPRNAWHCRYLGEEMRRQGCWIGEPVLWKHSNNHKLDGGNHRVRACQWLCRQGVVVRVPAGVVG